MTEDHEPSAKRRRLNDNYSALDDISSSNLASMLGCGPGKDLWPTNYRSTITCSGGSAIGVDAEHKPTDTVFDLPIFHTDIDSNDQVCFGMISGYEVQLHRDYKSKFSEGSTLCHIMANCHVIDAASQEQIGKVSENVAKMILTICAESGISTQLKCRFSMTRSKGPRVALSAIIYGPFELFDDIGDFLQDCNQYLQDPEDCAINVPYKNPHRLSRAQDRLMTFDLPSHGKDGLQASRTNLTDFVNLESTKAEEATQTPSALRTQLHFHQGQALSFMRRREAGWQMRGTDTDIWALDERGSHRTWVNRITGDRQMHPPLEFRGGILADEMGLGKTLSMISLVAADKDPHLQREASGLGKGTEAEFLVNATLIVVPPPLLQVWDTQLSYHLHKNAIRWIKYHGTQRLRALNEVCRFDIILTTYQTVVADMAPSKHHHSPIFAAHWRRIILDEAHFIRDRSTATARALRSLKAQCRWAMTGTPVQNRLTDFSSLLEFLRVHPYELQGTFDSHVSRLWKEGDEDEAISRLKQLVNCVVLRRLKTTIKLPDRQDVTRIIDFTPEERDHYETASLPVKQALDDAVNCHAAPAGLFLDVFQRINKLRMICNLGLAASLSSSRLTPVESWNRSAAQTYFESLLSLDQAICSTCSFSLDDPDILGVNDSLLVPHQPQILLSRCLKLFCSTCLAKAQRERFEGNTGCGHSPPCPTEAVEALTSAPTTPLPVPEDPVSQPSSKIKALVEDIQAHAAEKSVVFSFWKNSLDMVGRAMGDVGIGYVQVDSRVSQRNRELALQRLQQDTSVRVILITISCGAVGLDLTVASRAYLLEPQWNPTVEEQALARIHRMGQQHPVTTMRFIMKGSFEEHIVKVQKRKQQLTNLVFSNGKPNDGEQAQARLSVRRLPDTYIARAYASLTPSKHLRSLLG